VCFVCLLCGGNNDEPGESVMGEYLSAVFRRVQHELHKDFSALGERWLLNMLRDNDWWLRSSRAMDICQKLGVIKNEPAYYRDIKVWLPDEQFGAEGTPPCATCKSAANVRILGFRTNNNFGRRICALDTHYFIISRRYYCTGCKLKAQCERRALKEAVVVAKQKLESLRFSVHENEMDDFDDEDGGHEDDSDSSCRCHTVAGGDANSRQQQQQQQP
jgi:hypothetical protein